VVWPEPWSSMADGCTAAFWTSLLLRDPGREELKRDKKCVFPLGIKVSRTGLNRIEITRLTFRHQLLLLPAHFVKHQPPRQVVYQHKHTLSST
jgi:hypothetical protein